MANPNYGNPLIVEESPNTLNNNTHEGAFAASDYLGNWHSFDKKNWLYCHNWSISNC